LRERERERASEREGERVGERERERERDVWCLLLVSIRPGEGGGTSLHT